MDNLIEAVYREISRFRSHGCGDPSHIYVSHKRYSELHLDLRSQILFGANQVEQIVQLKLLGIVVFPSDLEDDVVEVAYSSKF